MKSKKAKQLVNKLSKKSKTALKRAVSIASCRTEGKKDPTKVLPLDLLEALLFFSEIRSYIENDLEISAYDPEEIEDDENFEVVLEALSIELGDDEEEFALDELVTDDVIRIILLAREHTPKGVKVDVAALIRALGKSELGITELILINHIAQGRIDCLERVPGADEETAKELDREASPDAPAEPYREEPSQTSPDASRKPQNLKT